VETVILHIFRLAKAGFIFTREGALGLIDPAPLPRLTRGLLRCLRVVERRKIGEKTARLSNALTRLGPTYVKLGQFLATRPDVIGKDMALNLTALQDAVPPFAQELAIKRVEDALEKPLGQLYANFSPSVAAASIAQVHKAFVGEKAYAVKIMRPNITDRFRKDLGDYYFAARFLEKIPAFKRIRPLAVVDTLKRSMLLEIDLRLEAAALSEMREKTQGDRDFYVPEVDWPRTARDVLTLEWIDGIKLNDTAALQASGYDLKKLGETVIQSFLRHALYHGFFHADMHQGNLFVDKQERLVMVDFGIMGRLGEKERLFLAQILFGFITRNYKLVADQHFEAGYVPAHHSRDEFAQAIRAIGEPIHSQTADQISMAKLLGLLFDVTSIFEMETRTELVLLQKTMVVVEGVARGLDPQLNIWVCAEPVIKEWLMQRLGVQGRLERAGMGAQKLLTLLSDAPETLERLKIKAETPVLTPSQPHYAKVLWVIAGLLLLNLIATLGILK
jgi:ubiquinone biosynthesis protein